MSLLEMYFTIGCAGGDDKPLRPRDLALIFTTRNRSVRITVRVVEQGWCCGKSFGEIAGCD